ncbi:MAG: alpha/beta fold hydrolase [Pirellulales bacterium]
MHPSNDHDREPGLMRRARAGQFELQVLSRGRGMPVLLVHGFPLDHSMWDAQIAHLSQRWQIIAPDLRGFGGSQVTSGTVTMEQMADDLAALADTLGIDEPIVLCGLSMGGYVALEFWRKYAARLRGLVLCDTRAAADTPEAAAGRLETVERVLREGNEPLADAMLPKLFAPATLKNHPNLYALERQKILAAHPEGVAAALGGMATRRDFRDELANISLPALVIVGEHDSISTVDEMRSIAKAIAAAEFVIIPGSGHMTPLENPDGFNEAIELFLTRVERGS